MITVLFVLGSPGAGKTTLVRGLFGGSHRNIAERLSYIEKPKWTHMPHMAAAGHYKGGTFDGADTVPYNGVQVALDYWEKHFITRELTVLDGDRFSYEKVKDWFLPRADRVCAVLLDANEESLTRRREERGSKQNPTWLKGRATKSQRFFGTFADRKRIDANVTAAFVTEQVQDFLKGRVLDV